MSRIEPIKLIENPLSGAVSTDEDEIGEGINEARRPLLRHSVKRHSTPSTASHHYVGVDVTDRSRPTSSSQASQIVGGAGGGINLNDPLSSTIPKSSISPSGSNLASTNPNNAAVAAAALNGKHSSTSGISQSQSLQILGNPPPPNKTTGKLTKKEN